MKLAILSRSPRAYSTKRLVEAARARDVTPRVLDTLKFSMSLEHGDPDLFYNGKRLSSYDAVIPRIGASITYYGCAIVRQFQQMDTYCVNGNLAIANSRDKLKSLQILSRHDIGIPATAFARDRKDVMPAIKRVGGAPVIIKLLEGTQGVGVILADSNKVAEAIIETLQSAKQNVLIQKFVAESKGKDVRAIVVGDRVIAAMRRVAQGQEFRSNVHRGGVAEGIDLSPAYERTAIRAAQILGLRMAGVDMLEGADGPQVMEVNSSPGFEGIETATGIDVAGTVIDYIKERVDFPEIDLRQRLTVARGFGVADFILAEKSDLVGHDLKDTRLRDQEVVVLTVTRASGELISSPRGDTRLEIGDRLLCFGKLETIRDQLPKRKRKTRKKKP
ncbi:MAG: RimK family alpha-L-glutamate ligase [Planctomycetota bacterium]